MIKETTILQGMFDDQTHDSVDAFFTAHGLDEWRAKELKLFTDAGFDVTDPTKQMAEMSDDGKRVIITVAYADQAEKDAIEEAGKELIGKGPAGLTQYITEDHLF
ncbi:uncharacterized protein METZ01_LOCUS77131 [marine metagenome]|uniref:Uncharacterized protein n=1 Tax=marine metagenome TaxID=408172 RepID=A0A381UA91_9ZZZZ